MGESDRARRVRGIGRGEGAGWRRATFLELFFDLVFVFALNQVSLRLINDYSTGNGLHPGEAAEAFVLFLALWMLWLSLAALTSRQHPDSYEIQIAVFMSMCGAAIMAIAVSQGFEERALVFAGAYAAARISRAVIVLAFRLARGSTVRVQLAVTVSAAPWIAGALVADHLLRGAIWGFALVLDYGGFALGYQRLGEPLAGEHLAERLQQFFLIALGEAIFLSSRALTNSDFRIPHATGFGLAFVSVVLLWRIYFYRAGLVLPQAITRARRPVRESVGVAGSHLFMIAGVVLAAVGFELYITGPVAAPRPDFLVAILGGPALVLAGRALFELQVFSRISRSRLAGLLTLGLLVPAMWYVPPLTAGAAVAAVLAAIAVWDAWRAHGRAPEPPAPPI